MKPTVKPTQPLTLEQHILTTILNKRTSNQPPIKILFPEGENEKVQNSALALVNNTFKTLDNKTVAIKDLIEPVLLFNETENIPNKLTQAVTILKMDQIPAMAEALFNIRKNKGLTLEAAEKLVTGKNYYGMMLLELGQVDCLVGGINYTTADILRPALQIIKAETKVVSSAFIMNKNQETYIFTDASINIVPDQDQLVNIASSAINFVKNMQFNHFDPIHFDEIKVAMLSYSTNGSGSGEDVIKVQAATNDLKKISFGNEIKVNIAGEIQFDAAFDETVRRKKFPELTFSGNCNIFVFPDLEAANIGYKIAQRLGNFKAIGPIVLGLRKPVNDLSRGATEADIYDTALFTCCQVAIK